MMTASVPYTSALSSRVFFFFSSRRRHTRCSRDWSSDVCSSDLAKQFGLQQVANAQPATSHLVFVGRADAARGCADFVGATRYFSRFIQFSVVRKDQVRTIADVQPPVHVHAGVCKGFHLGHQRGRIHHHACADDRVPLRPQNSAGDELQHEAVFSDDDGVPRVVASGNACNVVERAGQIVYDLALALITPLRAYHHNGFHSFSLFSRFPGSPGTTALTRPHPSLSAMP